MIVINKEMIRNEKEHDIRYYVNKFVNNAISSLANGTDLINKRETRLISTLENCLI